MGKGRPDKDHPEERFAFNVVSRILGVEYEPYDTAGRQGAVDALLHYPDGHDAALEVSSIGTEGEAQIQGFLDKCYGRREISGLVQVWDVCLPNNFRPRDLPLIDAALLRCERSGFDSLMQGIWDDDTRALLQQGANAQVIRMPQHVTDRRAYVYVREPGGWEGEGIQPLPDELAQQLQVPSVQKRIKKLADSGIDERHLFLMVRPSAFSFPVYNVLSYGGPLPTDPPRLPEGLSEVWLTSVLITGGVVRATAQGEWHWESVVESDRVSPRQRQIHGRIPAQLHGEVQR